jgi:hypothetical protein
MGHLAMSQTVELPEGKGKIMGACSVFERQTTANRSLGSVIHIEFCMRGS